MTKRATKGEASKSAKADGAIASWLGVDAPTLALARAGKLKFPKWWKAIFSTSKHKKNACADADSQAAAAYRYKHMAFELGRVELFAEGEGLIEECSKKIVKRSRIAKPDTRRRRELLGESRFHCDVVAVAAVCADRTGQSLFHCWIAEGVFNILARPCDGARRVKLSAEGRRACANGGLSGLEEGERESLRKLWMWDRKSCEWFLCGLVTRGLSIYADDSAARRRDIEAVKLYASETGNRSKIVLSEVARKDRERIRSAGKKG